MGITNRLFPTEVTSICNPKSVTEPNDQPDPTDHLEDIDHFARFMRASKVPPRDEIIAASEMAKRGSKVFTRIGCATCHLTTLTTAKAGTKVNGGQFTIPDALGEKPFTRIAIFCSMMLARGMASPLLSSSTMQCRQRPSRRYTRKNNLRKFPLMT